MFGQRQSDRYDRKPVAEFLGIGGLVALLARLAVHAVTLPVEFDASFKRALPVLDAGGYISTEDRAAAQQILKAAAFTYVAAAAMTLLDITRWARLLIR